MNKRTKKYDLFRHRHSFAVWAAARAAGRTAGLKSERVLMKAIPTGLIRLLRSGPNTWPSKVKVDVFHHRWCEQIMCALAGKISYGRAAKLLNVYLKCMLVLGPQGKTPFARWIHPPVDALMLKELQRKYPNSPHVRLWKAFRWTKADRDQYQAVINSFRDARLDKRGFWRIEESWNPGME